MRSRGFTLIELMVVMTIVAILAGLIMATVLGQRDRIRRKAIGVEISNLCSALEAYRKDLKEYPPDAIPGESQADSNEALVYWLGRKQKRGLNTYGPYMEFKRSRLTDADGDGFQEYRDTFDNLYLYAENESQTAKNERDGLTNPEVGTNPRTFDLVSPGPDGALGGTITTAGGFVANPAADANSDGKPDAEDDVYSWRLAR
jgi:prepilin-type N-terminal cleavage/methylation domain-containing protein